MFQPTSRLGVAIVASLLVLSTQTGAQTRRNPPRSAPITPATAKPFRGALVEGDPAGLFPADTVFYVDADDLGEAVGVQGSVQDWYTEIERIMASTGGSMPLSLDETRALLSTRVSIGFSARDGRLEHTPMPLAIARARSAAAIKVMTDKVIPNFVAAASTRKVIERPGGSIVVFDRQPRNAKPAEDSLAYAVSGNTMILGTLATVERALASPPPGSLALTDEPAFKDARARLGTGGDVFGYLNVGFLARAGWNANSRLSARPDEAQKQAAARKVAFDMIGLDALRALAFTSSSRAGATRSESLLEIDRSAPSLLGIVSDPQPVSMRAASVLPASTSVVISFGVQPSRIYDFLAERLTPDVAREAGLPSIEEIGVLAESRAQMKARELFDAFGDEVTVALDFSPARGPEPDPPTMTDSGQSTPPPPAATSIGEPRMLLAIEVKDPIAARGALIKLWGSATSPQVTERDHNGVPISVSGRTACAVVGGTAIIGALEDVTRALDSTKSGQTLARSQGFEGTLGQLSANTVLACFLTQSFADLVRESSTGLGAATFLVAHLLRPSLMTVDKEPLGLYSSVEGPMSIGSATVGGIAAFAIPMLLSSRRAASESTAIGNLRALASAEATFHSEKGRFGSMRELVTAKMLDSDWVSGSVRDGFRITQVRVTATTFEFKAEPVDSQGSRSFNVIQDYVIRDAPGTVAPKGNKGHVVGTP